jgi:hypothetical protein
MQSHLTSLIITLTRTLARLRGSESLWVQCVRASRLVRATHVPSAENLSDWLTKPLKLTVFLPMRARMIHFARLPVASP